MNSIGKTVDEVMENLRKRWGDYDSEILLSCEVRTMEPEERRKSLERIADLYLKENLDYSI